MPFPAMRYSLAGPAISVAMLLWELTTSHETQQARSASAVSLLSASGLDAEHLDGLVSPKAPSLDASEAHRLLFTVCLAAGGYTIRYVTQLPCKVLPSICNPIESADALHALAASFVKSRCT